MKVIRRNVKEKKDAKCVKDPVEGLRDIFRQGQPRGSKWEKRTSTKIIAFRCS